MASNILNIPFRKAHDLKISDAIKQYISVKYDQHPDQFDSDLKAIDAIRTDAIHVQEPHFSGITKLAGYAAQLSWMGGKFPIDIGVDFTWYPAIGYDISRAESQNNLKFELANILFNLAALYSQLATSALRSTTEGLKSACNNFALAAGTLQYIDREVIPDMRSSPPVDMDHMTLECLQKLMVAQAQECFWEKAKMDGLKDSPIARLAAQVADFYIEAAESGMKSDTISAEWIHHMTAKHFHFAAAAQYRAACDCLEKKRYGEEVARLRDAAEAVSDALKESRWINKTVLDDLQGLKLRVQETLKRAEKDNDMIYLQPVPPKAELKTLPRASMAQPVVPKEVSQAMSLLSENGPLGKPLFAKLVPFAVHAATDIYSERRDTLINSSIIAELETLTTHLHDTLSTLNLPGAIQAIEKPLSLPRGILSHAEDLRQQDGINRIIRTIDDVGKLRANCKAMFDEAVIILRVEAEEDAAARAKYGTERWRRPESAVAAANLNKQVEQRAGHIRAALTADETVKKKFKDNEGIMRLLAGPEKGLRNFVPNSEQQSMTPAVEREVTNVRSCLNEVNQLENRRWKRVGTLREKANADDISQDILGESARLERDFPMIKLEPRMFEPFFAERLKRYDGDRKMLQSETEEQESLLERLRVANDKFKLARRGDTSSKERQDALQTLENGYFKYKDIISNLDQGRNFYNELGPLLSKLRESCKAFAAQRRHEAAQLESDITSPMSRLSLSQEATALQQERQQTELQGQQQQQQFQRSQFLPQQPAPIQAHAGPQTPLPAPMPTRSSNVPNVWAPEMGIKFGGPAATSSPAGGHGQQSAGPNKKSGQWDATQGMNLRQ